MKKILIISLAFVLAACGAVQPVEQAAQEPPTPIVITVVVPGEQPAEAQGPTPIPLPTQEPTAAPPAEAPTEVPQPTAEPAPASVGDPNLTPVDVEFALGKGVFSNIKFSSDKLTLNCYPREMQITMTALMPDIARAEMFYRISDTMGRNSDWFLVGNLQNDGQGNFSITFKATDINPDYRILQGAWIDFQFVGVNRGGGVVDRTQRIERLVTYYKECP
jgi:hypothetical protein